MNREGLKKHEKLSHRKLLSTSKGRKQSMLRESHLLSEANVILYNASCSASVRLLPSFLLHVCMFVSGVVWDIESIAKQGK